MIFTMNVYWNYQMRAISTKKGGKRVGDEDPLPDRWSMKMIYKFLWWNMCESIINTIQDESIANMKQMQTIYLKMK